MTSARSNGKIKAFFEEPLFREAYQASLRIMKHVVPYLLPETIDGLSSALAKTATEIPKLIAASGGYGLKSSLGERSRYEAVRGCHEMIVMLSQCRDLYGQKVNGRLCADLIDVYFQSSRKLLQDHGSPREKR